jgi:hypothetical protein
VKSDFPPTAFLRHRGSAAALRELHQLEIFVDRTREIGTIAA